MTVASLQVEDALAFSDWRQFTARAQRLDPEGAVRLTVHSSVLLLTAAPLFPHGLGDSTPLALGMRILELPTSEHDGLDIVVPLAAVADRFARAERLGIQAIPVPPQEVTASWAGISPPRGPWTLLGSVPAEQFSRAAHDGIAEVAAGTPDGAGSAAVAALRRRVWARPLELVPSASDARHGACAMGAAFALEGLGFLAGADRVEIRSAGTWVRLTTSAGHVLTRTLS